ncbi:MAG TPA: hypothetical protein VFV23_04505 [Verrucomicrobiae bacterium]|nr:hypothetical protein [Verrucomicrobiae bacterium]
MKKFRWPVIAGLFVSLAASVCAVTITENFTNDPSADGWQIFGDTNLFQWNPADHNLSVIWDSSKANSYFYHPLGNTITRLDDFNISFDLQLNDITAGSEPGKSGAMEIAFSLLNFATATSPNFQRGVFGGAPGLFELDYFPPWIYSDDTGSYPISPTLTPTFVSTNSFDYAPSAYIPYEVEFPTGELVHVSLAFTASNQTLVATFQTNGTDVVQIPPVVLSDDFATDDDYAVDIFSITSYSSNGDPYDSVLAHGIVSNLVVTVPPPPIQNLSGAFSNSVWRVQFISQTNWIYTLQCTTNFNSWSDISVATAGNGTNLFLQDTAPPAEKAFYRVSAERP